MTISSLFSVRDVADRLWRLLPPSAQRSLMTQATALVAPIADRNPAAAANGLAIAGTFSLSGDHGDGVRAIAAAVAALDTPCWRIDLPALTSRKPDMDEPDDDLPAPAAPVIVDVNPPLLALALLQMPRRLTRNRRMIGYWHWDMPTVPPDWRIGSRFVHEVWTPSQFSAAALDPLLPGRVRVMPPPLAELAPDVAPLDRAAFGLAEDAIVVLANADFSYHPARENLLGVAAAFMAAFGDRADRVLVLRVSRHDQAPEAYGQLRLAARAPNIRVETRTMHGADLHALTHCADIVISLHRSTGLGYTTARAMLYGKPVIATGWSGNMDYMNADTAALVGFQMVPVQEGRARTRGRAAEWAEPDIAEATAHLRRLADDADARASLGARGQAAARQHFTRAPLAAAMADLGLLPPTA